MVGYHPFSEQVRTDPHPVYRALRAEQPVCYVAEYDCWALARFEDVWNAAQDPVTFSAEVRGTTPYHLLMRNMEVFPSLDMLDPPRHTVRRAALSALFTPGSVRRLEPAARAIVRERLDAMRARGELDVIADLGSHLSTGIVCRALGLPPEDGDALRGWVEATFRREPGSLSITPAGLAAYDALDAYFRTRVAARRAAGGGDDVIGRFLAIEHDGARLDDDAIASHLKELMIAGTETLPKVLASTLLLLWRHPDQRRAVIDDPRLATDAFLEALRWDTPTQFMGRTLMRDLELRGEKLHAGQPILLLYASANRDECEFARAEEFDIRRRPPRMLGFGHGTHACLGRHIATLEARVALEEILRQMPDYAIDPTRAHRAPTEFVQGWSGMPLQFRPF